MEDLFVMPSELNNFQYRHPEYNHYEKVYDKEGELAGYVAKVVKKKKK